MIIAKNDNNELDSVVVLCTAPDEATAQELVTMALDNKLAACATIIANVSSFYYWEGKLVQNYEVQILLKTNMQHTELLISMLKEHHPYNVPELLVLPVIAGEKEYLSWLNTSLA